MDEELKTVKGNDGQIYNLNDLELAHKLLSIETNPELYLDDGRCKQCVRLGLQ